MAESNFVIKNGIVVNGSFVANSSAVNAAAITATGLTIGVVTVNATTINVGTTTINSTNYSGTTNNALFLGGTAAASYLTSASLSGYQTTAGLAANVATLTSNNSLFLGGTAAASYALTSALSSYQTTAGLSANVAAAGFTNTSAAYTITGVRTHSANVIVNANVGIGTATPAARLSIKNDANNSLAMVYTENTNTGVSAFSGLVAVGGSATAKFWATGSAGGVAALGTDTPTPLQLFSNGVNRVVIAANGNIDLATMPTNSGLPTFGVRAWAVYNGQTQTTIGAGNISVTRSGTGSYRFTFTTEMPDTNYCVTIGLGDVSGSGNERARVSTRTTAYVDVITYQSLDTTGDNDYVAITVVR
jgi:hypothetical protein